MDKIGLTETIEALRSELGAAVASAKGQAVQFPVGPIQLEFHVAVTRDVEGNAGVKFWVLDLGTKGSLGDEVVQKVIVNLGPPVDPTGAPVKVARPSPVKP